MFATSAGPSSFRHTTIKASQRHARQLSQRRVQPRRAGWLHRCMAFDVTLITPEGEKKIQCDEGTLILDAADEAGLDLPYSCRSGSCGTCAAKLASGDMSQIEQVICAIGPGRTATCLVVWLTDRHALGPNLRKCCCSIPARKYCCAIQDDNSFLEDFMMDNGYFLTCSSYPKGDVTIQTNQEDNVYD